MHKLETKHLIGLEKISKKDIEKIIDVGFIFREVLDRPIKKVPTLQGKNILNLFFENSTRTKISFELAEKRLSADVTNFSASSSSVKKGESLRDTAKVLSQYADIVMIRTYEHKKVEQFSKYLSIPIINGLTDLSHPCQIMSDIMTFEEMKGPINNKKIAWVGDGNNVLYSLIEAAVQFNFNLSFACPKGFEPNKKILKWAKDKKGKILAFTDPKAAADSADLIMTDKWISMGSKIGKKNKKNFFKSFQVNNKIMKLTKKDSIFMHCLPANRGEEVTDDVLDGKQSVVWLQALNRIHVQKSIIEWCLKH